MSLFCDNRVAFVVNNPHDCFFSCLNVTFGVRLTAWVSFQVQAGQSNAKELETSWGSPSHGRPCTRYACLFILRGYPLFRQRIAYEYLLADVSLCTVSKACVSPRLSSLELALDLCVDLQAFMLSDRTNLMLIYVRCFWSTWGEFLNNTCTYMYIYVHATVFRTFYVSCGYLACSWLLTVAIPFSSSLRRNYKNSLKFWGKKWGRSKLYQPVANLLAFRFDIAPLRIRY